MVVLSEACTEPQFGRDEGRGPSGRAVMQFSRGGPESSAEVLDQDGISLFSYGPKELARKRGNLISAGW